MVSAARAIRARIVARLRHAWGVLWHERWRRFVVIPWFVISAWSVVEPQLYQSWQRKIPPFFSLASRLPWYAWAIGLLVLLQFIMLENTYRLAGGDAALATQKVPEIPDDQMGLLDYVPEGVHAMQDYVRRQKRLTKSMVHASKQIANYSGRLDREKEPNRKQRLEIRLAREIDKQSDVFEIVLPALRVTATRFGKAIHGFVVKTEIGSQEDRDAVGVFRKAMVDFGGSITGNRTAFGNYRQAVIGLRNRDLGWHINQSAERQKVDATAMVDLLAEIDSSCKKTIGSIDGRLAPITSKSKSRKRGSAR